jgi:V8-like Glu-specific endopeptidase
MLFRIIAAAATVSSLLMGPGAQWAEAAGVVAKSAPISAGAAQRKHPLVGRERLRRVDPGRLAPASGAGAAVGPSGASGMATGRGSNALPDGGDFGVQAYGSAKLPYTTARVAVSRLGRSDTVFKTPVTSFPYRATGKLWSRFGGSWYVCSASLIGKGLVLTAAHCVFNYGGKGAGWADQVEFEPAHLADASGSPVTPYGSWSYRHIAVPSPYYNGTDTCDPTAPGIVCNNDLALIVLKRDSRNRQAGNLLGWYRYGWNAYSYVRSPDLGNKQVAQITQLGYPVAFDGGDQMQRTDAVGFLYQAGNLKNTHLGSAQSGGSSGGPWIVNFGTPPVNSGGDNRGFQATQSIVGVTSWGYVDFAPNKQGASFFGQNKEYPAQDYGGRGAGNIGFLVNSICKQAKFAAECF